MPLHQAIIALGSNLGDRCGNLEQAISLLDLQAEIRVLARASLYETEPVGITDQPEFINSVIAVETSLSPERLMDELLEIERQLGRIRTERWGPRVIDLDLLFYENEIRETENLILPHPRWKGRTFVTVPLRELLKKQELSAPLWDPLRKEIDRLQMKTPEIKKID